MLNVKEEKHQHPHGHEEKHKKRKRGRPLGSTKKKPLLEGESPSTEFVVKRGRGRPRKCELAHLNGILTSDGESAPKKGRGRPRKIQKMEESSEESSMSCVDVSPNPMKTEDCYDSDEDISGSKPQKKELRASTSTRAGKNTHPVGVLPQRGWAQTGTGELLPPTRETHGSQYPGWETDPAPVSWVPGGAIDESANTVTHWVVEEPQGPQQCPVHAEGHEQHEFREDLLRGLAELRYQLTRELAAARGEMREGAELVRTAIDGVSAEIRRLCLLLQPLITMLTSGNGTRPQQSSSPASSTLRPQQDTPSNDPPSATQEGPHSVDPIVPQDTVHNVLHVNTPSGNTVGLGNQVSVPAKCPSPSHEDVPCSPSPDDHHQDMPPVKSSSTTINNFSKSPEASPSHTPDDHQPVAKPATPDTPMQQDITLSEYQQNISDALSCLSSIKSSLCQKLETSTENTSCPSVDSKNSPKSTSPPRQIMPAGQSLDEPPQGAGPPTNNNLCQAQDEAPVLLASQAVDTAVSLGDGSPNTVSYPSASNSPLPVQETSMLFTHVAEESLGMMSDNSVLSHSAATLSQDCIQMLQTNTMMSEDSAVMPQALPPSPHMGTASLQSERDVALMLSQDSKSPVSLADFPSMRPAEMDAGFPLS
ncbi:uncharacterized protein LOC128502851 [Spea bombifrons]|uniref:uncharacterized protein LOC128502851 n=1 Tax=Spea bombifrons TaxID=233779 RepID=UPI00234BE1C8|nr:uncharacterized protein LOC128502851 [Spea bombifrons]